MLTVRGLGDTALQGDICILLSAASVQTPVLQFTAVNGRKTRPSLDYTRKGFVLLPQYSAVLYCQYYHKTLSFLQRCPSNGTTILRVSKEKTSGVFCLKRGKVHKNNTVYRGFA